MKKGKWSRREEKSRKGRLKTKMEGGKVTKWGEDLFLYSCLVLFLFPLFIYIFIKTIEICFGSTQYVIWIKILPRQQDRLLIKVTRPVLFGQRTLSCRPKTIAINLTRPQDRLLKMWPVLPKMSQWLVWRTDYFWHDGSTKWELSPGKKAFHAEKQSCFKKRVMWPKLEKPLAKKLKK